MTQDEHKRKCDQILPPYSSPSGTVSTVELGSAPSSSPLVSRIRFTNKRMGIFLCFPISCPLSLLCPSFSGARRIGSPNVSNFLDKHKTLRHTTKWIHSLNAEFHKTTNPLNYPLNCTWRNLFDNHNYTVKASFRNWKRMHHNRPRVWSAQATQLQMTAVFLSIKIS